MDCGHADGGQAGVLAFGHFAEKTVVFKVGLALFMFSAEVRLEGCELGVGILVCLGKLGVVVVADGLKVQVECHMQGCKLLFISLLSFFDGVCCGVCLSLEVCGLGRSFDPFPNPQVCTKGGGCELITASMTWS